MSRYLISSVKTLFLNKAKFTVLGLDMNVSMWRPSTPTKTNLAPVQQSSPTLEVAPLSEGTAGRRKGQLVDSWEVQAEGTVARHSRPHLHSGHC